MGTYKKRYSYITEEIEIFYYVAQCQTFAKAARENSNREVTLRDNQPSNVKFALHQFSILWGSVEKLILITECYFKDINSEI